MAWSDDEHATDCSWDSDGDGGAAGRASRVIQDPEEWMDYYSEELLDLWYGLKERCEALGFAVLDVCTFPDFAQFCFQFSSGHPPPV